MGKKLKGNNDISQYIFDDYIFGRDLNTVSDTVKNLDLLVENNLATYISGTDDLMSMSLSTYRVACYFMCKQNKKLLKNSRQMNLEYEYGTSYKFADDDEKISSLSKYSLNNGTHYAVLGESDYAVLKISSEPDDPYLIHYDLYLIGHKHNKWKNKFFKLVDEYTELKKKRKTQRVSYSDGSPAKVARFKPFGDLVMREKQNIIDYIDNWVDHIPVYYNQYGMIPKLSILLYGDPGTGKSSFYKALADYLNIDNVLCIKPSYFQNSDSGMSSGRRGRSANYSTSVSYQYITVLDDIDCVCKARKDVDADSKDSEENDRILSNLLAFLDNPDSFYFKAKDGLYYPVQIVIATTNFIEKLDSAVTRYGRFDKKIHMPEFDREEAEEMCALYGLKLKDVVKDVPINDKFVYSPSKLQALCMENVDKTIKRSKD